MNRQSSPERSVRVLPSERKSYVVFEDNVAKDADGALRSFLASNSNVNLDYGFD
jgi:hypothetical protein